MKTRRIRQALAINDQLAGSPQGLAEAQDVLSFLVLSEEVSSSSLQFGSTRRQSPVKLQPRKSDVKEWRGTSNQSVPSWNPVQKRP